MATIMLFVAAALYALGATQSEDKAVRFLAVLFSVAFAVTGAAHMNGAIA